MKIEKCRKAAFAVMGKEGSTKEGEGFIQRLWADANSHFEQISPFAKRDADGKPVGIWGAMTDFSHSFLPWEDFKNGLYLAGVECRDDAEPPEGWVKWTIPGYEYLCAECDGTDVFSAMLAHMKERGILLAGAVQDFTCPKTGKDYMLFPIRKL